MKIGIPAGSSHVPTVAKIHVWPLTTTLDPPTIVVNQGDCTFVSPTLHCSFVSKLTAGTSYGLAIPGTGAQVGQFAPVTIQTRMNNEVMAGPVLDTNNVFDQITTDAAAASITLTQAKVTASAAKEFPGETAEVEWTFTAT